MFDIVGVENMDATMLRDVVEGRLDTGEGIIDVTVASLRYPSLKVVTVNPEDGEDDVPITVTFRRDEPMTETPQQVAGAIAAWLRMMPGVTNVAADLDDGNAWLVMYCDNGQLYQVDVTSR